MTNTEPVDTNSRSNTCKVQKKLVSVTQFFLLSVAEEVFLVIQILKTFTFKPHLFSKHVHCTIEASAHAMQSFSPARQSHSRVVSTIRFITTSQTGSPQIFFRVANRWKISVSMPLESLIPTVPSLGTAGLWRSDGDKLDPTRMIKECVHWGNQYL